ncbi:hypothetical protein FKM82_022731 [Ascaphus truei]
MQPPDHGVRQSSYDLLVQSQARELSSQREQMKESHSLCVVCSKNLTNMVKAFEELLLASDVDYYVAEGFREQLNQSITLIKKLEYKLGHGELSSDAEVNVGDFIQRLVHFQILTQLLNNYQPST